MILSSEQARAAITGRISVAFVPVRKPRLVVARTKNKNTYRYESQPWTPRRDHREPVQVLQGRERATYGYVQITDFEIATLEWLLQPTPHALKTAKAAGYKTRAGMADDWLCRLDSEWPELEEDLCPTCAGHAEIDGGPCPNDDCDVGVLLVPADIDDTLVLERFRPFATMRVYEVRFRADHDVDRYLSPAARPRGDDQGYTENPASAMKDAGVAVPATFQAKIARQASADWEEIRRARGEGRDTRNKERAAAWRNNRAA